MSSSRFLVDASDASQHSSLEIAGVVSHGSKRPIRLLVVDDDVRVRAAISQTIALED